MTRASSGDWQEVEAKSKFSFSYTCPIQTIPCYAETKMAKDTFYYEPV